MGQALAIFRKFLLASFAMAILCTAVWQFVGDKLYDCTDDGFLGFWRPGNWVHAVGGQPMVAVPRVIHGRSMSEPDTIKEGWTLTDLWRLWYAFVAVSVCVSMALALVPWFPRSRLGSHDGRTTPS